MPDPIFAHPRLAAIYDDVDADRSDLDHYESIVGELGARSVLDIGCGTGQLAVRLTANDIDVVGVDPAAASLDVARGKPSADRVRWIHGDATALPALSTDLAVMTGNVAQVFLDDDGWAETLLATHRALNPGGHLVFETRDLAARGWEEWTRGDSISTVDTCEGRVESWVELTSVALPFVSFCRTYRFLDDDVVLTSDSTLRFRTHDELTTSLDAAGFAVVETRGAPDRPGKERVFIAERA